MRDVGTERLRGALRLAAAFALLAPACASGPAPLDHFYRLEPSPAKRLAQPVFDGTLEVDRLRADALVGDRALVYRSEGAGGELLRHAYHHWVDPPTTMIQQALARYLRQAGVAALVVTPGMHVQSDVLVAGRVDRLERIIGGSSQVLVELELGVSRRGSARPLLLESYREQEPARSEAVGDAVAAFDRALSRIFERFVSDLARR